MKSIKYNSNFSLCNYECLKIDSLHMILSELPRNVILAPNMEYRDNILKYFKSGDLED